MACSPPVIQPLQPTVTLTGESSARVCVHMSVCLQLAFKAGLLPIYFPTGVSAPARDVDSARGQTLYFNPHRAYSTTAAGNNSTATSTAACHGALRKYRNYKFSPSICGQLFFLGPKHSLAGGCHVAKRGQGSHRYRGGLQDLGSAAGQLGQGCAAA